MNKYTDKYQTKYQNNTEVVQKILLMRLKVLLFAITVPGHQICCEPSVLMPLVGLLTS